jgi:hypothetical protein
MIFHFVLISIIVIEHSFLLIPKKNMCYKIGSNFVQPHKRKGKKGRKKLEEREERGEGNKKNKRKKGARKNVVGERGGLKEKKTTGGEVIKKRGGGGRGGHYKEYIYV